MCAMMKLPNSIFPLYINPHSVNDHGHCNFGPPIAAPVHVANTAEKSSDSNLEAHSEMLQVQIDSHHQVLSNCITNVKFRVIVSSLVRASEQLAGTELLLPPRAATKKHKASKEDSECSIGFGPASKLQRSLMTEEAGEGPSQKPPQVGSAGAAAWLHVLK